jgi:hypothetical protein
VATPVQAAARTARTGHYALPVPDGWADRTALTLIAPPAPGGFAPNAVVTREPLCQGLGLGGFADGQAALIRDHAHEFEVLSTEHGTLGGERALIRTLRWRIGDAEPVVQLSAYCVRDGHGVGLVCTAAADGFDEAEPAFRGLLAGFRFEPVGDEARS